jgi:hypothetical protein
MTVVEEACPAPEEEEYDGLAIPVDHPYHAYSDAELDSLAVSDPVAAVVLARRTESDEEAKKYYERAVALTGKTNPLIEWMYDREVGGLEWENDVLDVEAAKKGYRMYLAAAEFSGEPDPVIKDFKNALEAEGVDLSQIEQ